MNEIDIRGQPEKGQNGKDSKKKKDKNGNDHPRPSVKSETTRNIEINTNFKN